MRVKAVYLAIGITMAGEKEVLGLWLAQTEGAKFWLQVVTELRNRGVQDIFIACVDGLKGFPEAIEAVFPKAVVQLCIVHMVRHSLNYVSWKRRKEVAADLRHIYQAATAEEAELRLGEFEAKWDAEYLPIGQSWRRNWSRLTPFFDYPPEIRKVNGCCSGGPAAPDVDPSALPARIARAPVQAARTGQSRTALYGGAFSHQGTDRPGCSS